MSIYADTSLLFSLYSTDANSARADTWRRANSAPLPFTLFHRVELRNALSLAVFQRRLSTVEASNAWLEVEGDLAAGHLAMQGDQWLRVLTNAEYLVSNYTMTVGCRTLDVLHVAAAKVLGATEFCTFDNRQTALAIKAGLNPISP